MSNGLTGLLNALQERDRLLAFSARLQGLKDEGSLSAGEYSTGKADYEGRIEASTRRIATLKGALAKELEAIRREAEMCQLRIESAAAHHEAGELTDSAFESETRRWTSQLDRIEEQAAAYEAAIVAESAADIEGPEAATAIEPNPDQIPPRTRTRGAAKPSPTNEAETRTPSRGWTKLRIAALVAAAMLLVSVRLPWIAPTDLLGKELGAAPGISVTFLAALGGVVFGLVAIGSAFIRVPRTRGIVQLLAGLLAIAALVGAVFLGELPLHDSYFRELIVLREGFFAYLVAGAGLALLGIMQSRRWA